MDEPQDIGVLGETPTSQIIGDLYFGAYKTEHVAMMETLLNWASESENELFHLQYIQKLWKVGKIQDLQALADYANEKHLMLA